MEVSGELHAPAYRQGKTPLIPNGQEAGWAPEPVWTRWWREKFPITVETRTSDHPARNPALCHWAIPAPNESNQEIWKVKVKLSLCFTWTPRHVGVLGEWKYSSTHSLTSALDGGKWSVSRPGRFTPKKRAPGTYWVGGWVGPRTVLGAVGKRKIPSPRRESNPRTPIVQLVAQRYTDWAITAPLVNINKLTIIRNNFR
jgi:hypothetical protein